MDPKVLTLVTQIREALTKEFGESVVHKGSADDATFVYAGNPQRSECVIVEPAEWHGSAYYESAYGMPKAIHVSYRLNTANPKGGGRKNTRYIITFDKEVLSVKIDKIVARIKSAFEDIKWDENYLVLRDKRWDDEVSQRKFLETELKESGASAWLDKYKLVRTEKNGAVRYNGIINFKDLTQEQAFSLISYAETKAGQK